MRRVVVTGLELSRSIVNQCRKKVLASLKRRTSGIRRQPRNTEHGFRSAQIAETSSNND